IVVGLFLTSLGRGRREPGIPTVRREMDAFLMAMWGYEAAFDRYPSGSPTEILQALAGNNPWKRVFLVMGRSTNSVGEFVDPWGTPYKITVESNNRVTIRSAGENRSFGDK